MAISRRFLNVFDNLGGGKRLYNDNDDGVEGDEENEDWGGYVV